MSADVRANADIRAVAEGLTNVRGELRCWPGWAVTLPRVKLPRRGATGARYTGSQHSSRVRRPLVLQRG